MATIHGVEASPNELRALALTGYGHFTSVQVEEGAVRGPDLHLERLVSNAKIVFDADLDREFLVANPRALRWTYRVRRVGGDIAGHSCWAASTPADESAQNPLDEG